MYRRLELILVLLLVISPNLLAQDTTKSTSCQNLIEQAIKALGGDAYLKVQSERSQGFITIFRENDADQKLSSSRSDTQTFINYVILPNKERVDFKGAERKFIQSNADEHNWVYDSDSQILKDQNVDQRRRFEQSQRFQLDRLLRTGWHTPHVQLVYLSRQEVFPRQYAEGVKLSFEDGAEATLFFDLETHLPVALRFPRENFNGQQVNAENHFFKYLEYKGIKAPYVVDLLENNHQTLRITYEKREFNLKLDDKLFIKPANIKAFK